MPKVFRKGILLRKLLVVTTLVAVLGTAGVALADPNLSPDVPPHRHFIDTGDRLVQVGPRLCDNPNLQSAFNQFHANIHSHFIFVGGVLIRTNAIGPVAPGLQNGSGAEITARGCAFTG